jgi:hypothetical protein
LARAYLYNEDWANAEKQASELIANSASFSLSTMDQAFLRAGLNNNEAIWQLQTVVNYPGSFDASVFIIPSTGPSEQNPVILSNDLLHSFENGDLRKTNWVSSVKVDTTTYYYPYKFKVQEVDAGTSEYKMMFRLAEQYLIRAEARVQLGEPDGADDLNKIRTRAGLPNYSGSTDKNSLLTAILHERQVELFSEWGHRWLDLKRTKTIDAVMTPACVRKGGIWASYKQLYPVPILDIQKDPNLTQNTGY